MRPSLKVEAKVEEKKKGGKRHDKKKGWGDEFVYRTKGGKVMGQKPTGKNKPKHRDHYAHATPDMMRRKITNLSDYLADRQAGGHRH